MKWQALAALLLAVPSAYCFSGQQQVTALSCGIAFAALVTLGLFGEMFILFICVVRFYLCPLPGPPVRGIVSDGKPSFAIQGCGYLYGFATGALQYVYEHFEYEEGIFFATSAGAFPVIALVCGEQPIEWLRRDWPKCYEYYSGRYTGAFLQGTAFLTWLWDNYLPDDAHIKAEQLFRPVLCRLSFTRLRAEPFVPTTFTSRRHLLDVCVAAMGIPFLTLWGGWYKVDGERCVDGAFCVSAGRSDENTVLLSPFLSSCIKPDNFQYTIAPERPEDNKEKTGYGKIAQALLEFRHVFIPPDLETSLKLFADGYEQARASHQMLEKAGWRARPEPIPSKFLQESKGVDC